MLFSRKRREQTSPEVVHVERTRLVTPIWSPCSDWSPWPLYALWLVGPTPGQPTLNRAAREGAQWNNGSGVEVADFDELHSDWPTFPMPARDGADGVLELPIAAMELPDLYDRLAAMAPLQIGVTVFGETPDGALSVRGKESDAFAQLLLVVCG